MVLVMADVLMVLIAVAFFAVCVAYVALCDRVIGADPVQVEVMSPELLAVAERDDEVAA